MMEVWRQSKFIFGGGEILSGSKLTDSPSHSYGSLMPEGPKMEAEGRQRVGFLVLGRRQRAPLAPARKSGERCKLPESGVGHFPV